MKKFDNGFISWMETHYQIVCCISEILLSDEEECKVWKRMLSQGERGMYELAEDLTDKFEKENKGREWDGDFYEAISSFFEKETK